MHPTHAVPVGQDVYLHTNCLAALANMAPHVQNLNAYASQRLVSLFDMLARKYVKLQAKSTDQGTGKQVRPSIGDVLAASC